MEGVADPGGERVAHRARSPVFTGHGQRQKKTWHFKRAVFLLRLIPNCQGQSSVNLWRKLSCFSCFSSLVANGSGSVGEEKPGLSNNCFPTCRQIKPNRTIGSLATHHLFASHSPLVLEFLIQILSVSSFQPHKNSVKKDGVDFSFSGTDYKKDQMLDSGFLFLMRCSSLPLRPRLAETREKIKSTGLPWNWGLRMWSPIVYDS